MIPSLPALVLTLAALAVGATEGLRFQKRADAIDTSNAQSVRNFLITDAEQTLFYVPIQFGSGSGLVDIFGLVSTTRSDIILPSVYAKNVTGFVSQGKSLAEGPIYAGPVSAAGWRVPDQDIIYYENPNTTLPIKVDEELAYAGFSIWPNTSTALRALNDWSADSFISRVLAEPEAGPYWTLLISPLEDNRGTADSFGGLFTIGEIVNVTQIFNITEDELEKNNFPDLGLVTEYPLLNNTGSYNNVTYYAVIDAIKWGNVSATLNSTIPGTPAGKISSYIDSTYPWIQVPYAVTEQLYKNLENATYSNDTRLWYFKCTELAINITIAGYDYPLSPLTAVQRVDELNCVGTFQAKLQDVGGDVVLGLPFLKNVYVRFAYGTRNGSGVSDPYAQLMPVTDIEDAHEDWLIWYNKWSGNPPQPSSVSLAVRPTPSPSSLSSLPYPSPSSFSSPLHSSLLSSSLSSSWPSSSSSVSDPLATDGNSKITGAVEDYSNEEKPSPFKRYLPTVIVVSVVAGLALIGGLIYAVKKMRNGRDGKGSYRGLGNKGDGGSLTKVSHYDDEGASSYYGDGGKGHYTDPYDD